MVGGFFPTPYPDECLYSILCRYYVRRGGTGYETIVAELFGNTHQCLTPTIFFPMRLECIDKWVPPSCGITRSSITIGHTLYPYWCLTYHSDFRSEMNGVINGKAPSRESNNSGSLKSRRSWSKYLKYCPMCVSEDIDVYGETYWRRQHQLSEMFYCLKHKIRLINSAIPVRRTQAGFFPASLETNAEYDDGFIDNLAPYKDKLLRIGQEIEWLIKHGLEIDWKINGYEKYSRLIRDKGLASFQGRCRYEELEYAFSDYWGRDFLEVLFRETADMRFKGWTHRIEENKIHSFKPLYHILLMCFLGGSVGNFIKSAPADTPYGYPPFVCENPICSHYHTDGADMVALKYYSTGVTAAFECVYCGMRYKHNKAKYSCELRVVEDYGHLWYSELNRCCQDPKITNEQTSEILKCSMSVLMLQKKKQGLLESALYDTKMGPEKYYKDKVAELCKEYDEVTIALLQKKVPGAYSYLGDHHKEWLRSRIVFENERGYCRERKKVMLKKVREAVEHIMNANNPKRQITFGYIAKIAGLKREELRCNSHLYDYLVDIIESKEDWYRRRIFLAYHSLPIKDSCFSAASLCRAASITRETYRKYQNFIDNVITELII